MNVTIELKPGTAFIAMNLCLNRLSLWLSQLPQSLLQVIFLNRRDAWLDMIFESAILADLMLGTGRIFQNRAALPARKPLDTGF